MLAAIHGDHQHGSIKSNRPGYACDDRPATTMLGISRWTGKGGSYRSVQRFFNTALPWATLLLVFFRQHLWSADEVYLLAGDEVVVTKAGKKNLWNRSLFFQFIWQIGIGIIFFHVIFSKRSTKTFLSGSD